MKKFRFRLDPILRLKEHEEKEKQKAHAAALSQVAVQDEKLRNIQSDRFGKQGTLRNHLEGTLNIQNLTAYNRYFVKLNRDEMTGKEMLRAFEKNAEEKRQRLVEATKQRRKYEKLRDRYRERYNRESNLQEQKEQDEIAAQIIQYKKRLPS